MTSRGESTTIGGSGSRPWFFIVSLGGFTIDTHEMRKIDALIQHGSWRLVPAPVYVVTQVSEFKTVVFDFF